jgi:hypothetical protein
MVEKKRTWAFPELSFRDCPCSPAGRGGRAGANGWVTGPSLHPMLYTSARVDVADTSGASDPKALEEEGALSGWIRQ